MIGHYSSMTLRHPSKVPWTQGVLIVLAAIILLPLLVVFLTSFAPLGASPDMLAKNS